ncbi:MAG TPA: apolipoprotein N-acyltransferase [Actinoplanes sp.]|nr:apolipoprotein N-acyltransferase [Actinoplanes sp.]
MVTGAVAAQADPVLPAVVTRPAPVPLRVAVVLALLAGAALLVAFPPYGLWWFAPVGVGLLAAAVHRRRVSAGFGLGLLTGLVLFVPLLSWTNLHTGWLPWILLAVLQAVLLALVGGGGAWFSPVADRWRVLWPVLTGSLWVAQEALRDRAPFGGFPWGRLAFSQDDAPVLRVAVLGGAPAVTFVVAVTGGALLALAWRRWPPHQGSWRAWLPVGSWGVAVAALVAGPALVPVAAAAGPAVVVAIVQGNVPRLGLDFNEQRRQVLDNHVTATIDLAGDVAAGRSPRPALVVWPENASDIDPLRNADAARQITAAATAINAPILVGAVLRGDPGSNRVKNAGLLWRPVSGPDLRQLYVKRHPVPFAEYVPMRRIARAVSTKVDLVRSDMLAGTRPGVVRTGPAVLGDVICFEVAYDEIVRDTVTGGAELLAVQTNNATFDVAEARQQLAMVRLRAVEHGRESLMVSTVGVSAFVGASGRVRAETEFNTRAVVVREMRLGGSRTLATRLSYWPEVVVTALALLALAGAVPLHRRGRRADNPPALTSEAR